MKETLYFGKTFDQIFEKSFRTFTRGIEDHNFRHFNNSLGMFIYSKEQLKYEMKKRRMFPYEVCEELAQEWESANQAKPLDELTPKAQEIISSIKLTADKKGNIQLGGRAIEALISMGAISKKSEFLGYEGGFKN